MNRLALLFFAILLFAACKKDEPKIDPSVPLNERILGTWNITEIDYSGVFPYGTNWIPFSGQGESVSGHFYFEEDPNIGEFEVSFIAKIDVGLGTPISITANEAHDGIWEAMNDDAIIKMERNDTTFLWNVIENQENRQTWQTQFVLDYGAGYDSIPVDVQATMVR